MTIQEVARKLNLTQDTLRFYEKSGLLGKIARDKSGYRDYTQQDLRRIEFVKCMRSAELSIEVLRKYMDLYDNGKDTQEERKQLLIEQKKLLDHKLELMKQASERLALKIKLYEEGKLEQYLEDNKEALENE